MTIKTPLPDEVFEKFLKSKSSKDIEKKFGRKVNYISPMEVVGKEIHKSPALLFKTVVTKKTSSKKASKKEFYTFKHIEKEKFYQFDKDIASSDWKESETDVFLYKELQDSSCSKCSGNGTKKCNKCNGSKLVVCNYCKNKKDLQCKSCKGVGSIELTVQVVKEPGNKKEKAKRQVTCPDCHGEKIIICQNCGGSKEQVCKNCKGVGGESCKDCEGTGVVYKLNYSPVPFSGSSEVHVFWNKGIEKDLNKAKILKGKDLLELLEKGNVEPIKINNLKDLDQKKLEDELGFWDKEASTQIKDCKKEFEKFEKGGANNPKFPIEIYPLQKIDIETYKGKKFSICSVGSQNGYIVFDLNF